MTSIDLGYLFWNSKLRAPHLSGFVAAEATDIAEPAARISHDLDLQAVRELERAKSILGLFSKEMPTAAELLFVFRVISRCAAIASRHEVGLELHLTRGLFCTEYDQYRLTDILKAAEAPNEVSVGRCLGELLGSLDLPEEPQVAVISLRNDGELNQAILLASILKRRCFATSIILDTSGANEQYNFGEWVPLLRNSAHAVSRYIDYFLPRQDYKATLNALLECLTGGVTPNLNGAPNVECFINDAPPANAPLLSPLPIERAFGHYVKSLPVFYAAGRRTIVARLSPAKCHWAACKFCTINSQHLVPRGLAVFDSSYQQYFEILVQKIKDDGIESLILMDEALHPHVLSAFARAILSTGVAIVYRARCRFTNDLTPDACRTLYESGCRYLGLGLESASPRVNALVNKHMGPPIDYDKVLQHLDDAGIRMHVYAILGFPTETTEEIAATRDFLIQHIQRRRYLTVSANLFHLMRGSGIAQDCDAFGIERIVDTGDVALVLGFVERERARNQTFVEMSVRQVYQAEFLPDVNDPITAEAFWHFIDQTGIFYVQKVVHQKNPYHELAEARRMPIPSTFIESRYNPSRLFWLGDSSRADSGYLCDWVTFNYVEIPSWLKDFLFLFDDAVSLRANAENALDDLNRREAAYTAFRVFVQNGLFLQSRADRIAGNNPPPEFIFLAGDVAVRRDDANDLDRHAPALTAG